MKKGGWVSAFAAAAGIAAAAVAVTAFIKRKSEALVGQLDYDPDVYFESDGDEEFLYSGEFMEEAADEGEKIEEMETIPLFPQEQEAIEADEDVFDDNQAD